MTRAYDFVVGGVVSIIASIIHLLSVELFAPDNPLYQFATQSEVFHNTARANFMGEFLIVWLPLLLLGGVWAWVFTREYRRLRSTAVRRTA